MAFYMINGKAVNFNYILTFRFKVNPEKDCSTYIIELTDKDFNDEVFCIGKDEMDSILIGENLWGIKHNFVGY